MSMYYDSASSVNSMLADISDRHCPDSVRQSAYAELESRGYSHRECQEMADSKFGDYWG